MSDNTVVALIGLAGGVLVAVSGPLLKAWLMRFANGNVEAAKERQRFYRDLQVRLSSVEIELHESREKCNELERSVILVDELHGDLAELSGMINKHLRDHPQITVLMALIERMTVRMGARQGA